MDKSNLCSSWRQHSSRNMKHEFKVKSSSSWDYGNDNWGEGDLMAAGFSWPPRSYICSFCKREFRSAQALGGHMNVHRRDRARLRQSPTRNGTSNNNGGQFSVLNLNHDPNPSFSNPSSPPPFSSLFTKFPHFTSKLPPLGPLPQDVLPIKPNAAKALFSVDSSVKERGCGDFKMESESVRLNLEIGLISHSKEELDLELRLGYT